MFYLGSLFAVLRDCLLVSERENSQPGGSLTLLPGSHLSLAVLGSVGALTVLLAVQPLTLIFASVRPINIVKNEYENLYLPVEGALSLLFVVNVLSFILSAVCNNDYIDMPAEYRNSFF